MLVATVLAAVAFVLGRDTTWARAVAVALVVLSAGAALVAGGQAALAKYDRLAKVPFCGTAAEASIDGSSRRSGGVRPSRAPGALRRRLVRRRRLRCQPAERDLARSRPRITVNELPAAGWTITRDTGSELAASRGDMRFALTARCGPVDVEIWRAELTQIPIGAEVAID